MLFRRIAQTCRAWGGTGLLGLLVPVAAIGSEPGILQIRDGYFWHPAASGLPVMTSETGSYN